MRNEIRFHFEAGYVSALKTCLNEDVENFILLWVLSILVGCSYGLAYAGAFGGRFIEIMVAGVGFCKWFALLAV